MASVEEINEVIVALARSISRLRQDIFDAEQTISLLKQPGPGDFVEAIAVRESLIADNCIKISTLCEEMKNVCNPH